MTALKGQNFRILVYDTTASKFKCVGMSTNCSITLGTNSEESSTKDDTGNAKKPEIVSKNWQVSVESLDMQDIVALLTAMRNFDKFTLLWDEVGTTDNQTPQGAAFARTGSAYLTDLSITLNNRTNCSKSLQFSGTGQLAKVTSTPAYEVVTPNRSFTKGQYLRLFLGSDNTNTPSKVISFPTDLSFHVSMSVESASTKDTTKSMTNSFRGFTEPARLFNAPVFRDKKRANHDTRFALEKCLVTADLQLKVSRLYSTKLCPLA